MGPPLHETARVTGRWDAVALGLGLLAVAAVLAVTRDGIGLTVDSGGYLAAADGLLSGHGLSLPYLGCSERWPARVVPGARTATTQFPPGCPAVLAAVSAATGAGLEPVARWLGALCLGATVALAVRLVHRASGSLLWATVAGSLLVRSPLVLAASRALSEPLALLALAAPLSALLRQRRDPRPAVLGALCLAATAGSAVRFPGVVLAAGAAVALGARRDGQGRRRWREGALVLVSGALPSPPATSSS